MNPSMHTHMPTWHTYMSMHTYMYTQTCSHAYITLHTHAHTWTHSIHHLAQTLYLSSPRHVDTYIHKTSHICMHVPTLTQPPTHTQYRHTQTHILHMCMHTHTHYTCTTCAHTHMYTHTTPHHAHSQTTFHIDKRTHVAEDFFQVLQ